MPGVRRDAVLITDSGGNLLGEGLLIGTGSGSQVTFSPGSIHLVGTALPEVGDLDAVLVDDFGNVFIWNTYAIFKYPVGATTPVVVAGQYDVSGPSSGDGVSATSAILGYATALALDPAGDIYMIDRVQIPPLVSLTAVRKVDSRTGIINTVAGTLDLSSSNLAADGSLATSGALNFSSAIAIAPNNDLYIATLNASGYPTIRKVDGKTGIISTVAGGTTGSHSGDSGPASAATFDGIYALAFDSAANLYVLEQGWLRRIDASTQIITTIAGTGVEGTSGQGGPAVNAQISANGLALDAWNNIFLGGPSGAVQRLDPLTGILSYWSGSPNGGQMAEGSRSDKVSLSGHLGFDKAGNPYQVDGGGYIKINVTSPTYSLLPLSLSINDFGDQPLNVSSESLTGSFSASTPATSQCAFPGSLAADTSCFINLGLNTSASYSSGALTLTDDNSGHAGSIQQATLAVSTAQPSANPSSLNLGTVLLGTGPSSAGQIAIQNPDSSPFILDHTVIQGPNASVFSVPSFPLGCQAFTAGGTTSTCSLTVSFTPFAAGTQTSTLLIYGNTANPVTVPLTGSAVTLSDILSVTPSPLNFVYSQLLPTQTQTVTISNTSATVFFPIYRRPTLIGSAFSVANDECSPSFNSLQSNYIFPSVYCPVSITFTPPGPGSYSGSYTLNSINPIVIPLLGTYNPAPGGLNGPFLTFSAQQAIAFTANLNQSSAIVPLELTNSGNAPAAISSISTNNSEFRQYNNCPSSLPVNQSCTIWVSFLPASVLSPTTANLVVAGSISATEPLSGSVVTDDAIRTNLESPTASSSALSGTIQVSGWAGEDYIYSQSLYVSILIDNTPAIPIVYPSLSRPDVCAAYPALSCTSGFSAPLDTTQFANGFHTLSLLVYGTDTQAGSSLLPYGTIGQASSQPIPITISNPTTNLPQLTVDFPSPSQSVSGTVGFSGWALDPTNYKPVNISLSVDGLISLTPAVEPRPDVCTALHLTTAQCQTYYGWWASFDTTSLPPGPHTLIAMATATGTPNRVTTKTIPFTIAAEASPRYLSNIEQPAVGQTVSGPLTGGALNISGWAVTSGPAFIEAYVQIDDGSKLYGYVTYGLPRPDVCAAYSGRTGCPNVGWNGSVGILGVSDGPHKLVVTFVATDGSSYTITRQINVANITLATDQLQMNVETPLANQTVSGTALTVSGWVVDGLTLQPSVEVLIDGTSFANVNTMLSRPDVCGVYSWSLNCPTPGFVAYVDTTLLTDGAHTLEVQATAVTGKRISRTTPFVSSNVMLDTANGQHVFVETPASGTTLSGVVGVEGWAISTAATVQSLDISIDGLPIAEAQYGLSRPDVCKVYPNSKGCPNVGWYYSLDTRTLADGLHTLQVIETTSLGSESIAQKLVVANNVGSSAVHAVIDAPAANAVVNGLYFASGWAIDDNGAIASVGIAVDGIPQGTATYGNQRTDVCNVFPGRAGCPNVGWTFYLGHYPIRQWTT